jgi:hypothetical protein
MRTRFPSLCLEYGADEENCERELEISERGMCFHSRWQFAPGTQIGVNLCYSDVNGECKKAALEGIIVDCHRAEQCTPPAECDRATPGCYRVTVLFLDLPESLLGTIRDVSSLLGEVRPPPVEEPGKTLPALFIRPRQAW